MNSDKKIGRVRVGRKWDQLGVDPDDGDNKEKKR